ncbi:MAG: type II toxin-antitoxin system VapC family toxin [Vulcanimicrobiaceae bacterium]
MRFVLDASLALSWFFEDERDDFATAALYHLREFGALVPNLWCVEIGNGLVVAERRKRIDGQRVATIVADLSSLPVSVEETGETVAFSQVAVARAFRLTNYDATYLDLARRHRLLLATRDKQLAAAADGAGLLWKPVRRRKPR